ncbi:PREDICTED: 21 kDa seed protein-like [Nelumbo nucifera]|uniref:21 kDa seed protein-like n=1 Tax=Nelumbo nucifera TaxID=4432 RepID=A0A1U7ZIM1_NELNU|nr:PREDICTED: 21 kDa seed protein-like [Nelumbo nucifera]
MATTFLISSLLIVISSIIQSEAIASSHKSHQQSVLDTDGNEIQAGQSYYIVSAIRGGGGGVSLDRREKSHSLVVRQHGSEMNFGTPISFSPASASMEGRIVTLPKDRATGRMLLRKRIPSSSSKANTILESADVNIRFSGMPVVWQVQESQGSSSSSKRRYVAIGGQPGHPGSSTVKNWFKIERISKSIQAYRIAYCPSVCESCEVVCGNVGILSESDRRWLSVSENTEFAFVFVKVRHD